MQNSPQDLRKKVLGRQGEDAVCKLIKKRKYKILQRNYTTPFGEADIVALDKGVYVFVEVKTRASDIYGEPTEAVTREKQRRYRLIAQFFCKTKGEELPVRFDVAALSPQGIEYIENAF